MERWPYVDALWRLDVLNGGTVNVGGVQVAGVSGAGKPPSWLCGRGLTLYQRQQRERGRLRQWRAVCD